MTNTPLDPLRSLYGQDLQSVAPAAPSAGGSDGLVGAPTNEDGKTFGDVLKDYVDQVDKTQNQYEDAIAAVNHNDSDNVHRVMLAQGQAQLSLKLAVEVRNKLVDAYKEVMRTQF